jgi:hypothetical protein
MENERERDARRRPYERPTITRVHADPVNELLMFTGVCFFLGDVNCTNTNCG